MIGTLSEVEKLAIDVGQIAPGGSILRSKSGSGFGFANSLLNKLGDVCAVLIREVALASNGVGKSEVGLGIS